MSRRKMPAAGSASLTRTGADPAPKVANGKPEGIAPVKTAQLKDDAVQAKQPAVAEKESVEPAKSGFVVQVATLSGEANAIRAAAALNGFVVPSGKFYCLRAGPYTSRGQANAALAKVTSAGYSDARVITAG